MSEHITKDYTTDELLAVVNDLPVGIFGYREFETLKNNKSATVSDNYPEGMTVIELEAEDGSTADLLYSDSKVREFKPHFIG